MQRKSLRIADMLPVSKEIPVGKGVLVARPLSLPDIIRLVIKYGDEFVSLYAEAQKEPPEKSDYAIFAAGSKQMVAEIIARSCDRLEEVDDIAAWPGTVHIAVLSDVWLLSVPDPKKLVEAVSAVLGQMLRLREELAARARLNASATTSPASSTS